MCFLTSLILSHLCNVLLSGDGFNSSATMGAQESIPSFIEVEEWNVNTPEPMSEYVPSNEFASGRKDYQDHDYFCKIERA